MNPLQVACSYSAHGENCGAEPGDPCRWLKAGCYHSNRIETAAFVTNPATTDEVDAGQFESAVEASGLV